MTESIQIHIQIRTRIQERERETNQLNSHWGCVPAMSATGAAIASSFAKEREIMGFGN